MFHDVVKDFSVTTVFHNHKYMSWRFDNLWGMNNIAISILNKLSYFLLHRAESMKDA